MSITSSSSSGDDRLQVGIAVFCLVISLMVTTMIPIMAPGYEPDYSADDIMGQKAAVQGFTGESMTNQTPWILTGVYTPYVPGMDYGVTDEGWLYGTAITDKSGYQYIGDSQSIKLDPTKKSSVPLDYSITTQQVTTDKVKWYWAERLGMPNLNITNNAAGDKFLEPSRGTNWLYEIAHFLNPSINPYVQETHDLPAWNYSGYRYEFDPMLMINTSSGQDQTITSDDAKLSIVWYDTYGSQGLSGGLVLYNEKSRGIVANITEDEIISNYNLNSSFSSKYSMVFEGIHINLNIRFDPEVVTGAMPLDQAWDAGKWSLAFTATSAGSLMDIKNSNSLDFSVGNLIDTYVDIFTFDIPNVPGYWSIVLWVICVLPIEIVMMMFLSRFGLAGVGMGVLGNVLLAVLG